MTIHLPLSGLKKHAGAKTPITLWRLLVWAYRTQMVQYETDRAREHRERGSFTDELLGYGSAHETIRGCINGAGTTAHDDAHVVHAHVQRLKPRASCLLISYAALGRAPEWNPVIPPLRVVPVRKKGSGRIRMMWDENRHPIQACLIAFEGEMGERPAELRQAARSLYSDWWLALRQVRVSMSKERRLRLWWVSEIGAEAEPWR